MILAGRTVLVPRGGERGAAWAHEIELRGGRAVIAPLVSIVPPSDPRPLHEAVEGLAAREYGWLALTSVNAVHALTALGAQLGGARVAVVGEVTAQAAREAGWTVDLVPQRRTAAGLLAAWREGDAALGERGTRVLLPLSALAADTLETGLAELGFRPDRVDAYDVAPLEPAAAVVADVAAGRVDAIILSSGSVARRVAEAFGPVPASVTIACIGEPSASAAREAGLTVHAVASRSTGPGTVEALERWFGEAMSNRSPTTSENRENNA